MRTTSTSMDMVVFDEHVQTCLTEGHQYQADEPTTDELLSCCCNSSWDATFCMSQQDQYTANIWKKTLRLA
jgi:hypothetical protein